MSQANQTVRSIPGTAPTWEQLYERAEYTADVKEDPTGGVVVHRCHPDGVAEDFFAFGQRHETMKGYVDKQVYLFRTALAFERAGSGQWNSAVGSFHFRHGSHEDCPVCQGTADPDELLAEVIETATEQVGGEANVTKSGVYGEQRDGSHRAEVYIDSHGRTSSGDTYDVQNSTRHWHNRITSHPYVQMAGAEEVGEGGNTHSPDNTLKITLRTWYPNSTPGVEV